MFQFLLGVTTGIFIAQNYDIPDVKALGKYVRDTLVEYEKKNKKN